MHFNDLLQLIEKQYGPALLLRDYIRRGRRLAIERGLFIASVFLFILTVTAFALQISEVSSVPGLHLFTALGNKIWGLFLVVFTFMFIMNALEAMHRSYYFTGLSNVLAERDNIRHSRETPVGWGVATIVSNTQPKDITGGFLNSTFGQEILYRSGVSEEAFAQFVEHRTPTLTAEFFVVERDAGIMLATYVASLLKHDPALVQFLADNNISNEQCIQAARWVSWIEQNERRTSRWWSRDNLGRIPGIGKTWGYGETYLLTRYGHDLVDDHMWGAALMSHHAEEDEVEEMEKILSRARQANVLVVGDDLMSARQKVAQLYRKIRSGSVLPPLEGKQVFFVDLDAVVTAFPEKSSFEEMLNKLMAQALHAGNTILYVEHFAPVIESARTIGVDLVDRLSPYLESDKIQFITATSADTFNARLQRDGRILQTFDVVRLQEVSSSGLLDVLKQRALAIEKNTGVVYTIPALETVARLADQYFPAGVMPDKAFDLLEELAPMALGEHKDQLTGSDVEALVSSKTGIPAGAPSAEESKKLLELEDFMHTRVVGQERAVSAVAKALRRSRAGIGAHTRPMGSFLFLGPTGVGKTETAKALAEALFGSENVMARLDMSEFQGPDALERLLGTSTGTPGRLVTLIREKPYGVLLLDEFEKSAKDAQDLFLQVLDEGIFTDTAGKKVNARNMIIIATSNAGADLVWEWEKENKDVASMKRDLIDALIDRGLFRPEFLNRFDDIVVFHALTKPDVHSIAEHQLSALQKRLKDERHIDVQFSDDLVDYVSATGFDPQFGGRPMRRVIQEAVEQAVADSILRGTARSGSHITLTRKDVEQQVVE